MNNMWLLHSFNQINFFSPTKCIMRLQAMSFSAPWLHILNMTSNFHPFHLGSWASIISLLYYFFIGSWWSRKTPSCYLYVLFHPSIFQKQLIFIHDVHLVINMVHFYFYFIIEASIANYFFIFTWIFNCQLRL